jgi:hypothetical protein
MRRAALLPLVPLGLLALGLLPATRLVVGDPPPVPPGPAAPVSFAADAKPFLETHCASCHGGASPEAGFDLAAFTLEPPTLRAVERLLEMRARVVAHEMPPLTSETPPPQDVKRFVAWADRALVQADQALPSDPGRVVVRRLSRFEYGRTVKHLLALDFEPGQDFPADDLGYGFDNIGASLSMSPLLLEKYADAATAIARSAVWLEDPAHPPVRRLEAEGLEIAPPRAGQTRGEGAGLHSHGSVIAHVTLPRDGEYVLRTRVFGQQAGPDPARLAFVVDQQRVVEIAVPETQPAPGVKQHRLALAGGRHEVGVAFINDYYRPAEPEGQRDRNLVVDWLEVVGPVDVKLPPASHARLFAKDPARPQAGTKAKEPAKLAVKARAEPILKDLLARAWRRPPAPEEVKRLVALVEARVGAGEPFEAGIRLALQAVLVSPHFLFRIEPGATTGEGGKPKDLDGHALATRLSYFLWSSLPDEPLTTLAQKGRLADPAVLEGQARRMLADPRAAALAENFAVQWLELRRLTAFQPDPARFPGFEPLRASMRREAELLFDAVRCEQRDLHELLTARFTFVDRALAAHYGLPAPGGEGFVRVDLPDATRGGVLGLAGVLAVTSNPTRTSPVKRGKWVLENLLDAPPRPPPPGADSLDEVAVTTSAATLRESMEKHRQRPDCASCHVRMDALGFALERFDPVGRLRTEHGGKPIDSRGMLPDGRAVDGLAELRGPLQEDRAFVRCLARKLFTFALGRAPEPRDELQLFALAERLPREKATLDDLIVAIVRLDAFRKRSPGE